MMKNHNLTPHDVTISDAQDEFMTFPASGQVLRMSTGTRVGQGYVPFAHPDAVDGVHSGVGAPCMGALSEPAFSGLEPLKDFSPRDGDLIIVSAFCGESAAAKWPGCWVVSPDTSPGRCDRDDRGQIKSSYNWILYGKPPVSS